MRYLLGILGCFLLAGAASAAEREVVLAVDVGGSSIKVKPFTIEGKPLGRVIMLPTPPKATPRQIEDAIAGAYARVNGRLALGDTIVGVVVGFPGPVRGRVRGAPNLDHEAWRNGGRGYDLEGALTRRLGVKTFVDNDMVVPAHGLAKRFRGRTMVMALGTGLGIAMHVEQDGRRMVLPTETGHMNAAVRQGRQVSHEYLVGEAGRRRSEQADGMRTWKQDLREVVLPAFANAFQPDRIVLFGGNALHLSRDRDVMQRLQAAARSAGTKLTVLRNSRFVGLTGAVPYFRARTGR